MIAPPGGISAVDFDNNGLYDLFIPDGVDPNFIAIAVMGPFEETFPGRRYLSGLDGVSVAPVCRLRQ